MREECIKVAIKDTKPKVDYKCALVSGTSSQSGESVEVTDIGGTSTVTKAEVTLEHTYSKNGYDSVWAGGSGKNKLRTTATEETVNGLTFNPNDDGTINVSGTSTEALTVSTDSEIYSKRVVENGYRLFDELVGGSVVWNQKLRQHERYSIESGSISGASVSIDSDGYLIVTGTNTADCIIRLAPIGDGMANHVYMYTCDGYSGFAWSRIGFSLKSNPYYVNKHNANFTIGVRVSLSANVTYNIKARFKCHDLTQLFGNSSIADYIYQLEQSNSGSGVALFKKLFNEDYYSYNVGTIMSVCTSLHEMIGFNLFDISTSVYGESISPNTGESYASAGRWRSDWISVFPSTEYYWSGAATDGNSFASYYDENKNYLGRSGSTIAAERQITTPSNCAYVRLCLYQAGTDTREQTCFHLMWSGKRNGEYEPYQKNTYTLSPLTLRGIPKLVDNKIVYDGDVYKASGEVTRRYAEVDLGTLEWSATSTSRFYVSMPDIYARERYTENNALCTKYIGQNEWLIANLSDKHFMIRGDAKTLYIYDSAYTDAATFKTAMNGVKLIYELATPTTESTTPFTKPQECEQGGTEEYIDYEVSQGNRDVSIPVGHNTFYADYVVSDEAKITEGETYNVSSDLIVARRNGTEMKTASSTLTVAEGDEYEFTAYVGNGNTSPIEPMIYQSEDSSYLPYENLGKLSEYEAPQLNVTANGETTSYTTLLNPANYGGSYDFVSGKETRTWGHIESYNGETLPTVWESDRDDYVAGTTPSVGAEVCYELATPTETQYTAQEIALTSGATSTLSSPQGNITVVVNQPVRAENV